MTAPIRLGRIPAGDRHPCQATDRASCKDPDYATYRAEAVNPETGEVWSRTYCTAAAAAFAARRGLTFPPGPWKDPT